MNPPEILLLDRDPLRLVHPEHLGELPGVDVVVALLDDHERDSMLARHDTGVSCSPVMGGATRAALRVSAARLRSRPLRPLLVVSGVALAFAMLVAVVGGSLVARQQALKRGLSRLPASARGFRVDRFGLPLSKQTYRREDRAVRRVLGTLASGDVKRVVFFRQLRIGGQLVEMAAIDGLPDIRPPSPGQPPAHLHRPRLRGRRDRRPRAAGSPRATSTSDRVGVAELRDPSLFGYVSAAAEGRPLRRSSSLRRASRRSSGCLRSLPTTASTRGSPHSRPTACTRGTSPAPSPPSRAPRTGCTARTRRSG